MVFNLLELRDEKRAAFLFLRLRRKPQAEFLEEQGSVRQGCHRIKVCEIMDFLFVLRRSV
jgi:hypothetical protein